MSLLARCTSVVVPLSAREMSESDLAVIPLASGHSVWVVGDLNRSVLVAIERRGGTPRCSLRGGTTTTVVKQLKREARALEPDLLVLAQEPPLGPSRPGEGPA